MWLFLHTKSQQNIKRFSQQTMAEIYMLLEQIVLSILSNQMRDTIINIKGSWQLIPLKISRDNWSYEYEVKKRKKVPICVTF